MCFLMNQCIVFFLGGLFYTDNFSQEQKETVNFISQTFRDYRNYVISFQSKICFLSHGKFLIWQKLKVAFPPRFYTLICNIVSIFKNK